MSLLFAIIGAIIFFTPTKVLLKIDRRTGYSIYKSKLDSTQDEELALKAAGFFYRCFGAIFFFLGILAFITF
jgi:hypothetical protein